MNVNPNSAPAPDTHEAHGAAGIDGGAGPTSNGGHAGEPVDLGGGGQVFEPETVDHANSAYGTKMSSGNVESLATKMGIDYQGAIDGIKNTPEAFLDGRSPEQKEIGANQVLNAGMQFKTLDKEGISPDDFYRNAATAKKLALAGDEQGLEDFINQNGNNPAGLQGKELVAMFEPGEHLYNHPILNSVSGQDPKLLEGGSGFEFKGHDYYQLSHLTSLNTNPGGGNHDGFAPGTVGGYNDGGGYFQDGTSLATYNAMARAVEKMGLGSEAAMA
jgi:hypothetical protein